MGECYDRNDDGSLSRDEFNLALQNPDLKVILKTCMVDVKDLLSYGSILFGDQEAHTSRKPRAMRIEKFLKLVLRLRGNNSATVADIVSLREFLEQRLNHMRNLLAQDISELPESPQSQRRSTPLGELGITI